MEQILIVEDDTDINNMMASALTKAGYECKQSFSGTEAMLYLNKEKFSVIILDLKYFDLSSQIEQLQKQRESLQESAETESTMKKRIAEFRRTLEENEVLDTFDRYVFESIVEKVIVGGYDEDGNKDPAMLTFIYKTGFKNSLDGTNFKPPRKNSKAAKQNAGLCSHTTDEAKSMCSYHSDDTDRHGGGALHQADEHAGKRRVEPRVAH